MKTTLFNWKSRATARKDDHQNSHGAANKLNNIGAVQIQEKEVLKALKANPGSTAKELGVVMANRLTGIDILTCRLIIEEAGKAHRRLSQMESVQKIEQKPENIYYAM